jgi:hypothetical protein
MTSHLVMGRKLGGYQSQSACCGEKKILCPILINSEINYVFNYIGYVV